jgi:hypothetical protein
MQFRFHGASRLGGDPASLSLGRAVVGRCPRRGRCYFRLCSVGPTGSNDVSSGAPGQSKSGVAVFDGSSKCARRQASLQTHTDPFWAQYTWIFGINMIMRVGVADWSAWIVYVLVGSMQIVLIIMAVCFTVRDRRLAKEGKQHCATPAHLEGWDSLDFSRSRTGSVVSHVASNMAPDERSPLFQDRGHESTSPGR